MRNLLTSENATRLGLFLARAPLGAYLLASGFEKFSRNGGVDGFLQRFAPSLPTWLPHAAGEHYLRAIPYAEIVIGASLLLGVATRVGGLAASLLLASNLILLTGIRPTGDQPFQPNVAYLGVALLVLLVGPGKICMDTFMWKSAANDPEPKPARQRQSFTRPRLAAGLARR